MGTHTIKYEGTTRVSWGIPIAPAIRQEPKLVLRWIQILLVLLLALSLHAQAVEAQNRSESSPGIRNSQQARRTLSQERLTQVARSLENLTGLTGITFDSTGTLSLDQAKLDQFGSATAREILHRVIETTSITLEDYNRSVDVAFAKITPGVVYLFPTGKKVPSFSLQVDFQDFEHLGGDEDALKAFDLGFVLLHELVHAVENKRDPVGRDGINDEGECEEVVNLVREELGLPTRLHYRSERVSFGPSANLSFERIKFARSKGKDGEPDEEIYFVQWPTSFVTR
jgi:hypothetical protein